MPALYMQPLRRDWTIGDNGSWSSGGGGVALFLDTSPEVHLLMFHFIIYAPVNRITGCIDDAVRPN
jgi:hypothetical protein